jgi:hypothetical protein
LFIRGKIGVGDSGQRQRKRRVQDAAFTLFPNRRFVEESKGRNGVKVSKKTIYCAQQLLATDGKQ